MSSPSPRRLSFALAAALGLFAATAAPHALPAAAAQNLGDAGPAAVEGPATPAGPRANEKAIAETAWYLFFVTAAALFGMVGLVWGIGWYKRTFLEDDPLQTELFDAATRAEIERHRKEVQAEQEAAKRAAEADTLAVGHETLPNDPDYEPDAGGPDAPGDLLAEQTAAPPDPAVQPDPVAQPESVPRRDVDAP